MIKTITGISMLLIGLLIYGYLLLIVDQKIRQKYKNRLNDYENKKKN